MSKVADKIAEKVTEANLLEPQIKQLQEAIQKAQNDLQVLYNRRSSLIERAVGLGELIGIESVDDLVEAIQANKYHLADKIKGEEVEEEKPPDEEVAGPRKLAEA